MATAPALELNREDIVKLIEGGARARRGVSAAELVQRYLDGTLRDPGEVADLLALTDLLPDDDELFKAA